MTEKSFWTGPFGIHAAAEVYQVPSRDGVNWVDKDGIETEMPSSAPLMDETTYLEKYGTKQSDGSIWYVPPFHNFCGGDGSNPHKKK